MENKNQNIIKPKGIKQKCPQPTKGSTNKRDIRKIDDIWSELKSVQKKYSILDEEIMLMEWGCDLQVDDLTGDCTEAMEDEEIICIEEVDENSGEDYQDCYNPIRSFALTLYYFSPEAYEHICKVFNTCLPPASTVRGWYVKKGGNPGFTAESFEALKSKSQTSQKEIIANLTIRENQLRWTDCEYVDVGNEMDTDFNDKAKAVLIFMVTAINSNWKIPVGYFFDYVQNKRRAELIRICLEKIHETGIKIVSVSSDDYEENIKTLKCLGGSLQKPMFPHPITQNDIVYFLDSAHVLYTVKMGFAPSHILIDKDGRLIQWKYLDTLDKLQKKRVIHLNNKPKLNFKNIRMKAKRATDLFDFSVADAMDHCRENLKMKDFRDSAATADFIRLANNLYNIYSSKLNHEGLKNALNAENAAAILGYLDQAVKYLSALKGKNGTPLLKELTQISRGFHFLVSNATALKNLYHNLILNGQCQNLPTYKLTIDPVQQFFRNILFIERVRGNGGPRPFQFKDGYKKLMQVNPAPVNDKLVIEKISFLKNCTAIDRINVTTYSREIYADWVGDNNKKDTLKFQDFNFRAFYYTVAYITALLIRKLNCEICLRTILSREKGENSYIVAKSGKSLLFPSQDVTKICRMCEVTFQTEFLNGDKNRRENLAKMLATKTMKCFIDTKLFDDIKFHQVGDFPAANHVTDLMKAIVEKYLNVRFSSVEKKRPTLRFRLFNF